MTANLDEMFGSFLRKLEEAGIRDAKEYVLVSLNRLLCARTIFVTTALLLGLHPDDEKTKELMAVIDQVEELIKAHVEWLYEYYAGKRRI